MLRVIVVGLLVVFVLKCECTLPTLCIEKCQEGKFLSHYHLEEIENASGQGEDDDFFLPRTLNELCAVYEAYSNSSHKNVFFSSIIANIECELSARCKDGIIKLIDNYLGCLSSSFNLFLNFDKDHEFSNLFFRNFRDDIWRWLISMENIVRDSQNDFTRELLHLEHVVYEISNILIRVMPFDNIPVLFDSYRKIYLSDDYESSQEYKRKYEIVSDALCNGLVLDETLGCN